MLRSFIWSGCLVPMLAAALLMNPVTGSLAGAVSLKEVQDRGALRHLGVPYANFITGSDDGFEVELMKAFADFLQVRYQFVQTTWQQALEDVSGKRVRMNGTEVDILGDVPVKGDILASGVTVFAWRKQIVDFGTPTFPTQVWVMTKAESGLRPIVPGQSVQEDIQRTIEQLHGKSVLGVSSTCLDPAIYGLDQQPTTVKYFQGSLNELAPAVIYEAAEATLLDVPDAIMALRKWPGKIKVLGPISPPQVMAPAFAKDSDQLRKAFDSFLRKLKEDGGYKPMISKYYPSIFQYFPEFFSP